MDVAISIPDEKIEHIIKTVSEDLLGKKYDRKNFERIKEKLAKRIEKEVKINLEDIVLHTLEEYYE